LASSKNITRTQKVVAPTQKERPQKFTRQRLDFSALDSIGHGIKVTESTEGIDKRYDRKYSGMEVSWECGRGWGGGELGVGGAGVEVSWECWGRGELKVEGLGCGVSWVGGGVWDGGAGRAGRVEVSWEGGRVEVSWEGRGELYSVL
jgi:hypothetical protein